MVQRHFIHSLLILVASIGFSCASSKNDPPAEVSSNTITSHTPPFTTREPLTYQAVRETTFSPASGGEATVTRVLISRDGEMRREEESSRNPRVVYLQLPEGRFLLLPDEKIYAALLEAPMVADLETSENLGGTNSHATPIESTYENLGSEVVNGQTTTKYRVTVSNSSGENVNNSETFVWIDDKVGMPVRSVTRSALGSQTMELTNITMAIDRAVFELPKDFQQVEFSVLQKRMK